MFIHLEKWSHFLFRIVVYGDSHVSRMQAAVRNKN